MSCRIRPYKLLPLDRQPRLRSLAGPVLSWGTISVSVTPTGGQEPFLAVAKIFDAMYYPFRNQDWGRAQDVVYFVDIDYSLEASGLEYAEEIGQAGQSAPKYFDS